DANAQTPFGRSILGQLKYRNMPKEGQPWTDNEINMLSTWIYDGQKRGTVIDLTKEDITFNSHMKPSFPPNVIINRSDEPVNPQPSKLNFNDHVIIMFALGHRNAMLNFRLFDLHKYDDVNAKKVEIFHRLTRTETDTTVELMPQNNPWPRKNIILFYTWAIQGPKSRESSESADPQPYSKDDPDYVNLQNYHKQYLSYIENGERKV
ncbi:16001_t:CDS:1, partial [Cetraspora pellucida]